MFIPSTFKRPVSSWKALNLRGVLLMASSVRLKPLNCSRLPCVYAQETLTFLLTQKRSEERRVGKECRSGWWAYVEGVKIPTCDRAIRGEAFWESLYDPNMEE